MEVLGSEFCRIVMVEFVWFDLVSMTSATGV